MSTPRRSSSKRDEIEAWWALLARILSFILGAAILAWQTFGEDQAQLWLILAGIALVGPAAAQSVAAMLASLRGTGAP